MLFNRIATSCIPCGRAPPPDSTSEDSLEQAFVYSYSYLEVAVNFHGNLKLV